MKFIANISMCDPTFYVPLAQVAEEAGFDTIAVPDSIAYPKESSSTYPYNFDGTREFLENKPFIEPIVAISAMAAVTSTIEFHTFVLKMPIRHPVMYAKEATSLAVLSDNRFVLGVGSSPWPDDYEIVQLPWEGRGRRFDECIEIVRGLAAGGYFEYHGEFYDFPAIKMEPVPTQPIPVLIGGHTDVQLRHAARLGDGWMGAGGMLDDLIPMIDRMNDLRKESGRIGEPVRHLRHDTGVVHRRRHQAARGPRRHPHRGWLRSLQPLRARDRSRVAAGEDRRPASPRRRGDQQGPLTDGAHDARHARHVPHGPAP